MTTSAPGTTRDRRSPARLLVALVVLALGAVSCDSTPLLFPTPEGLELASGVGSGGTIQGTAGEVVLPAVVLRVVDGNGNPVPNATVRLEVEAGGGSVPGTEVSSDRRGRVVVDGWRLGETAGTNRLRLQVRAHGGVSPGGTAAPHVVLEAQGIPGAASRIASVGAPPPALEGTVGEALPAAVRFRVEDRFGNPVPGVDVTFTLPSGSGSVASTSGRSDATGEVGPGSWTLGPEAGLQVLRVVAAGVAGVDLEIEALARPGDPERIRIQGELPATAPAGEVLGDHVDGVPVVQVVDAFGNPLPDIQVTVTPLANSGTVGAPAVNTGPTGTGGTLPAWTLGTTPGTQGLRLVAQSLPGVAPLEIVLQAVPGAPATLEAVTPTDLSVVSEGVALPAPTVRVEDRFGNPVPGVAIRFSGPGTLTDPNVTTGPAGTAAIGTWRVGAETGTQILQAELLSPVAGVEPVAFVATVSLATRILALVSGGGQTGTAGMPLEAPIMVRLTSADGTPLPDVVLQLEVVAGGGSVSPATRTTAADGQASIGGWVLGGTPGINRLRISEPGGSSIEVEATGEEGDSWQVLAVHVNQGNQTFQGTVPLVADRPGLLRVFLRGSTSSPPGIRVRIRVRQGGSVVVDEVVGRAGGGGIEVSDPDPDDAGRSWNLTLAAGLLQPGAEIRVDVDPDGILNPAPSPAVTWPAGGGWHPVDVRELPTFRATFIPIQVNHFGLTGRITPANVQDYVGSTVDQFPMGAVDFEVRTTPLVFDGSFANPSTAWVEVLQDVRDLRLAENGFARYYHGILQRPPGPGIAGIAYVVTNPQSVNNLAAVSFDELPTAGPVIAHEFGHNFGRNHAPCGNAGGVDPNYPHPGGQLGGPGYSASTGTLRPTTGFRDVMGYCFPMWASDYTFGAIRAMREARPVGMTLGMLVGAQSGPAPGSQAALLIGGSWTSTTAPRLRPALRLEARPTPTEPGGDVQIHVLDAGGGVITSGRYSAVAVDHADDPTLRHFGAVLPLPAGSAPPASIRVTTPAGVASLSAGAEAMDPTGSPLVTVESAAPPPGADDPRAPGTWARIRWDVEAFPVLVLRDAETGHIRGFLRSGDAVVPLPAPADDIPAMRMDLSDGVRTLESVPIRRGPERP